MISTNEPYENNQDWIVEHSCSSGEQVEFKFAKLDLEESFDHLYVEYGNNTIGKLINYLSEKLIIN